MKQDPSCSWISRLNILKMAILGWVVVTFNTSTQKAETGRSMWIGNNLVYKTLNIKKPNNSIKKWSKYLNREFSSEESQIDENHLKKCSISSVTEEIQIRSTLRLYLASVRMSKINNTSDSLCWWGCRACRTLVHCWGEYTLYNHICKLIQSFLRQLASYNKDFFRYIQRGFS